MTRSRLLILAFIITFAAGCAVEKPAGDDALAWKSVAELQEMMAAGGMERVVRILLMWNTERSLEKIQHVYLGEARQLRPDFGGE